MYQLNPKQKDAVRHIHGPLLVLAGAGSGKTSVITQKISYLINECGYKPNHIAAITFTNKASREMNERVKKRLKGQNSRGLIIATFHNLGLNFIRKELALMPLRENFSIFDGQDCISLLKELSPAAIAGDKSRLMEVQSQISSWKNELLSPKQGLAKAKDADEREAAHLYERYQRHLHAYNAVDFDDLIRLPVELLEKDESVRDRWQKKIRYLLVDEYQDTNTCQYQLVKYLVGLRAKLTVVGDDDQSIYSWRGAKPENLGLLKTDFPTLEVIKLEQNYRSSGRILKAANQVIDHNPHLFEKKLWSEHAYGEPIRVIELANEDEESARVTSEIITLQYSGEAKYGDFAVLYRGNHQARIFEKAMITHGIPYNISGGTSFFARAEIKDIMSYLRLISNHDDDNAFLRVVNVPRREIGPGTLETLGKFASEHQLSLFSAAQSEHLTGLLSPRRIRLLNIFVSYIESLPKLIEEQGMEKSLQSLLHATDYQAWLIETSASEKTAEFRWRNVQDLTGWINKMQVDDDGQIQDLATIVNKLMLRDILDRHQEEDEENEVQLMTLHSAKGLEFPRVYLVGMEEELLPHKSSIEEDQIEEERRLAYVGITRAKEVLTMTMARNRKRYGEWYMGESSRFLDEMPQEDLVWEGSRAEPLSETDQQQKNKAQIANLRRMLGD